MTQFVTLYRVSIPALLSTEKTVTVTLQVLREEHYRASLKGSGQVWGIGGGKIAFRCLLQAGERNFFTSYSPNLAGAFLPSPVSRGVDIVRLAEVHHFPACIKSYLILFTQKSIQRANL